MTNPEPTLDDSAEYSDLYMRLPQLKVTWLHETASLEQLAAANAYLDAAQELVDRLTDGCVRDRKYRGGWAAIGRALGITAQGAAQSYKRRHREVG